MTQCYTCCIQHHQLYPIARHSRGVTGGHTMDRWRGTSNWWYIFDPRHVARPKKVKKNQNQTKRNISNKQKNTTTTTNQPINHKTTTKTNNKNQTIKTLCEIKITFFGKKNWTQLSRLEGIPGPGLDSGGNRGLCKELQLLNSEKSLRIKYVHRPRTLYTDTGV